MNKGTTIPCFNVYFGNTFFFWGDPLSCLNNRLTQYNKTPCDIAQLYKNTTAEKIEEIYGISI